MKRYVYDGSADGIYLPGEFAMVETDGALEMFDPQGNKITRWVRYETGDLAGAADGSADYRFLPGDRYGYLGIGGVADDNEVVIYAANTSTVVGSNAGALLEFATPSGGFAFIDFFRYSTSFVFEFGWRQSFDQDDSDSMLFSTTAGVSLADHVRFGTGGSLGLKEITAPSTVSPWCQFYVDEADHHFKMKNASGTVTDFSAAPAGLAIGNTVTGGTANRALFVGPTGLLANSANFTYDSIGDILRVGTALNPQVMVQAGQITVNDGGANESIVGAGTLSCTGDLSIGNAVTTESPGAASRTIAIHINGVGNFKLFAVPA